MIISCDVDCGELLPGHRFVVTGLRDDGLSDDAVNGDHMGHHDGKPVHRVASLTYAFVPGLPEPFASGVGPDLDATVALDPPPDPAVWGAVLTMGGERDARPGGSATVGAFGPFVLPEGTRRLSCELSRIMVARGPGPHPPATEEDRPLGTFDLELGSGNARWTPA